MATNTPIQDQCRGGTHRERFLKLQAELREFSEGANPEEYEAVLYRFLTEFEHLRLKNEQQMLHLQKELSFCEGTARSCNTVANTLVSVLRRYREELKRGTPVPEPPKEESKTEKGNGTPTDTDVLKTICVCGCQDAEDAAECNCSCHKGVPCDNENCVVCQTKKEQLKAAATKKKSLPRKKATKKKVAKKVAKKKVAKKKVAKKS